MFWKKRARFWTDSIALTYANPEVAVQWWTRLFSAKRLRPDADREHALPSDVWLSINGYDAPQVYLAKLDEVRGIGLDWIGGEHHMVLSNDIELAHRDLREKGASPTSIRDERGPRHFEITDPEGNVIEICEEV